MPSKSFLTYLTRGWQELLQVRSLGGLEKLYKQTQQRIFLTLYTNIARGNKFKTTAKPPKILFIDSTGNDGAGIGDAIFSLPTLDALGTICVLDVLTIQSRSIIFQGQENIRSIFTAYSEVGTGYDNILLLHPSINKYKYVLTAHGLTSLLSILGSTYTSRFQGNPHVNHIELVHAGINDVIPELPSLSSYSPKINLSTTLQTRGKEYVGQYPGEQKICISVGCKEEKKDYKNFYQVIELLARSYPNYTFLLLGDDTGKYQEKHIDQSIDTNIIFLSGSFTLEQTFALIGASDGIIGIDGGLTNAGIGLGKETYMIFNIINPEEIIPQDYPHVTTNDVGCDEKCYYTERSQLCHHTNSRKSFCLDNLNPLNLFTDIAGRIDKTYS